MTSDCSYSLGHIFWFHTTLHRTVSTLTVSLPRNFSSFAGTLSTPGEKFLISGYVWLIQPRHLVFVVPLHLFLWLCSPAVWKCLCELVVVQLIAVLGLPLSDFFIAREEIITLVFDHSRGFL